MATNVLSARKVETAPPQPKPYFLKDGGSLFLAVRPNGSKLWHYRYRIEGRPQIYSIGRYPDVSLESARAERDRARDLVKKGVHPRLDRKMKVAAQVAHNENTFESVARRWMASNSWSEGYTSQITKTLEKDVFPEIGTMPTGDIRAGHLRPMIQKVGNRGAKTVAVNIRMWCSQIFEYAVIHEIAESDPAAPLKGLVKRRRTKHNPPLTWAEVTEFFSALAAYGGFRTTVLALKLMSLTYVRTIELRKAKWKDIDLRNATWAVPQTKMHRPHLVPLSQQAIEVLNELQTLTGGGTVVFPNHRKPSEPICATTLNRALEYMGFGGRFSGHGFRSTATTLLALLGYPADRVDLQLAHAKKDSSRAPYDHTKFISSRRVIMQQWADILDALAAGKSLTEVTSEFGPLSAKREELRRVIERED
ncbi:tyrosine-type recombinase/integrase [Hydrocarboniphaga sp.]|uniref:tyrosine-type recombinase/integrase n=1 Tax=Hydrocarboniphaga sp. TaxID=2033016 RepID=UPI002AB9883B|nr:integrase arm-type DNA-binding domain-containing protein [Hydrocarboniphaga sp.]MDZ4077386.1 integrase arm-type DNA-binding domain-containing protein [Hydrocarboniphaga sp.]